MRPQAWYPTLVLTLALCAGPCAAGASPLPETRGPDRIDAEYTRSILENTTDPEYLTAWVDHLPASDAVPSPLEFLGHAIGTPDRLTQTCRPSAE